MTDQIIEKPKPLKKPSRKKKLLDCLWHFLATALWLYVFTKLFVFDIDIYFARKLGGIWPILIEYKFFLIFGVLLALGLIFQRKNLWLFFLFFIAYPILAVFLFIPWTIIKLFPDKINAIFLLVIAILSLLKRIKLKVYLGFFAIAALFILFKGLSAPLSYGCAFYLIACLMMHYFYRVKDVYSENLFTSIRKFLNLWDKNREKVLLKELKEIEAKDPESKECLEKRTGALQTMLIANRAICFASLKFKKFKESKTLILYLLSSLTYTWLISVFVFAFIFYGLQKTSPFSFTTTNLNSLLWSVYYSFMLMIQQSISGLEPVSSLAIVFSILARSFGLLIGLILVFVIITIMREKHDDDIDTLVDDLEAEAATIGQMILVQFKLSLVEAEKKIKELKPEIAKLIDFLSIQR